MRHFFKDEPRVIRFIILKKHGYVAWDTPFLSSLIEGIEKECRAQGYELLISHIIHNEHNIDDIEKIVKQNQVAGILLLATEMDEIDLELFNYLNFIWGPRDEACKYISGLEPDLYDDNEDEIKAWFRGE